MKKFKIALSTLIFIMLVICILMVVKPKQNEIIETPNETLVITETIIEDRMIDYEVKGLWQHILLP
jgi:hypothetical protein